MIEGIKLR